VNHPQSSTHVRNRSPPMPGSCSVRTFSSLRALRRAATAHASFGVTPFGLRRPRRRRLVVRGCGACRAPTVYWLGIVLLGDRVPVIHGGAHCRVLGGQRPAKIWGRRQHSRELKYGASAAGAAASACPAVEHPSTSIEKRVVCEGVACSTRHGTFAHVCCAEVLLGASCAHVALQLACWHAPHNRPATPRV